MDQHNPIKKLNNIILNLVGKTVHSQSLSGLNICEQYLSNADNVGTGNQLKHLNAAFLIALAGENHPLYERAVASLNNPLIIKDINNTARFYRNGLTLIKNEVSAVYSENTSFRYAMDDLNDYLANGKEDKLSHETLEKIRSLFFPEGVSLCEKRHEKIRELRSKRVVSISGLNPEPVKDPATEILFTSNILLTVPLSVNDLKRSPMRIEIKNALEQSCKESQRYWYDHPVPAGVAPEHNEILYGLEGLDHAIEYEKQRGNTDRNTRATCVLSVSVTHEGLHEIAKSYIQDELRREKDIRNLDVYIFTETDTDRIINDILVPAAAHYLGQQNCEGIRSVFGVDGEYGRHYSFLKAVAAFWQVLISPEIKGTFKIDLDQVFPQDNLVSQSGSSAFEHLMTSLWGATGTDTTGNEVEMGMIAGALVNQSDINKSLFIPDVCFPPEQVRGDEIIFLSTLPQALSTEAEMMTRYEDNEIDGKRKCIQRIHVTGGTCGILIDSLRKYRPFTPTFIGRAEDQAYIMSVLFNNNNDKKLRYAHKDGLIMRHDKHAFAVDAIKKAATGKIIGDYIRMLMFTYYSRALPWNIEKIKEAVDPFTGCFISRIPLTIVYLRFALRAATFCAGDDTDSVANATEFIKSGVDRIGRTIDYLRSEENPLKDRFLREKEAWDLYYDILDSIEQADKLGDEFAAELKQKSVSLIKSCRITDVPCKS